MSRNLFLVSLLLIGILQSIQSSQITTYNDNNVSLNTKSDSIAFNKVNKTPGVIGWKGVNRGPVATWNSINREINNTSSTAMNNISTVSMGVSINSSTGSFMDGSNNGFKPFVDEHTKSNGNIANLNAMMYVILFSVFILITNSFI